MYQRGRQRKEKTPLLVKEVILPRRDDSSGFGRNSTFRNNNDRGDHDIQIHSYKKTGQNEPGEVVNLVVLREKPLEDYLEGTRKRKKVRKRKRKDHGTVISPSEFFSDGGQTLSKGEKKQTEKELTTEEKTEIHLLDLKIYEYEKMREEKHRKNWMRQRKAEESYICQLERLTAKWFKPKMRKCITKDVNVVLPDSFPEEFPSERIMKKTASRKFCSENSECPPGKSKTVPKEKCHQAQPSDNVLEEEFYAKLVFVDEDSDEFDYDGQNLQFRRNLRKH